MGRIIDRLLGFSASLRLAVIVIVALAGYLAIGTAYEARYGARASGEVVYGSPTFVAILAVLALNVLAAAVIRFPWKRHQTGFVVTHAGILVLLAGCLIGQRWGMDGRLALRAPGGTEDEAAATRGEFIDLPAEQLAIFDAGDRAIAVFPLDPRRAAGHPSPLRFALHPIWPVEKVSGTFSRRLGEFEGVWVDAVEWHPAVRVEADGAIRPIRVKADDVDSSIAAVRVRLTAMGRDRETWVVRGDPPVEVQTPGGTIKLGYGFAARKLPFAIELIEARRTADAVSARVRVRAAEYEIAPNRPVTIDGLTIYLSSVERVNGQIAAFLSVRRDPGWAVKYAGCALTVLGTALMFVIRRRTQDFSLRGPAADAAASAADSRSERPRRNSRKPTSLATASLLLLLLAPVVRADVDLEALRVTPIEHEGRVKPVDTMASEIVRFVRGRGTDDDLRTVASWSRQPSAAAAQPWVLVENLELREKLGMPRDEKWIAPARLRGDAAFLGWSAELARREQAAEADGATVELSKLDRAAVDVLRRLETFDWASRLVLAVAPTDPETARRMRREVAYNQWHPFRWVGVAYGVALVGLLVIASRASHPPAVVVVKSLWLGCGLVAVALLAHAFAFAWRCSITGWAPVTNMYETVVWVGGVAAILGLALTIAGNSTTAAVAGSIVALLACVVGDVMPPEFGRSITNLAPVLQSNLWLTVHVLTVVSSYAAFAVALVLGNVALWQIGKGKMEVTGPRLDADLLSGTNLQPPTSNLFLLIYRCIQIGVVLIAAGTVLGGVWADYSWGRFWGWDPKEVWALIVLLSYLALLHGRYVGWVGPFGLAAGAVVCFLTVLMSWYGVNFVLGVGLHSYGFGAGGLGYVMSYVAAQAAFVIWARWRYRSSLVAGERRSTQAKEREEAVVVSG